MAYGEIYNTTWWGVALDTARTAGTEPDFFGSQMKLLTSNQPELVTNGDFATDSDWTAVGSGGWTISGGSANSDGTSSASAIYQQNILEVGKIYEITFTAIITSGTVAVSAGFSGAGQSKTASGTYTEILTAATNDELYIKGTSNFIGSIDNISVKEVRLDLDQIEAKKCLADWIHTTALKDLNN